MKFVFKDRKFTGIKPRGRRYIPKYGEVLEAVNEDTGDKTLVMVKKDGPQGGCEGCIAASGRWDAGICSNIPCSNYEFILIDINDIMENL